MVLDALGGYRVLVWTPVTTMGCGCSLRFIGNLAIGKLHTMPSDWTRYLQADRSGLGLLN